MEQVHAEVVVQEQAEVLEWVDHEGEERVAPEQVQALGENACVQNVGRLSLMMQEHHAPL
jgi:hypothetical protein